MQLVKLISTIFAAFILWASMGFAQENETAKQFANRLDQQRQSLQVVTDTLDGDAATPIAFDSLRDVLRERRSDLQTLIGDITPFLEDARAQLEGLGPVPTPEAEGDTAAEPENIQTLRKSLEDRANLFEGLRTEATLLDSNASRLLDRIADLRRQDFISGLFEPVGGFNADQFWPNVKTAIIGLTGRVLSALDTFSTHIRGMAIAAIVLFAALIGLSIRRSGARMDRSAISSSSDAFKRVSASLRSPIGTFTIFAVLALIFACFVNGELPQADSLFVLCLSVIGLLLFAYLLLRRLAAVGQIGTLTQIILFVMIAVFAIDGLVLVAGQVHGALLELVVAQSYLSTGLIAVLALILAAKQHFAANFKLLDENGHPMITILFAAFGFLILTLNLMGYPALARFVVRIVLLSAFLGAFVYVLRDWGRRFVGYTMHWGVADTAAEQDEAQNNFTFYWRAFLFDVGLLLATLPVFARIIGLSWSDIQDWSYQAFFGFQVGAVNISIVAVFFGLCLFLGLYLATRLFQRVLDNRVLTKTRLTASVRQSIVQIIGYIGLAIALLLGVASMGFDLSNIALIAGALSVGIGFGLQSIVSNFVSGLILLFERPIKVGDWVATSTGEGMVRKISVRATEIETFDKNYVIVPNAELISNSVKNWTHHNNLGRLKITIGASYDADPHKVKEVLERVAEESDEILSIPQPSVFFRDFGDNALIFDLRVFVRDILYGFQVETQLRLDIWDAFKAAGIEISYPQRDIHIRTAPPELAALAGEMDDV